MVRLQRFSIKARLIGAVGIIVAMMGVMGLLVTSALNTLAGLTDAMYQHPLQVSNASLRASLGVARMNLYMEDALSPTPRFEQQEAREALQAEELLVNESLNIIADRILGQEGQSLGREARELFDGWAPIRREALRLRADGTQQAAAALRASTAEPHVDRLDAKLAELNRYAQSKGEGFRAEALRVQRRAGATTIGMVLGAALLAAAVLLVVLRSIVASIEPLQATMADIARSGKFSEAKEVGRNELSKMTRHFNALIRVLKEQFWLREGLNALNRELSGAASRHEVLDKSVTFVSRYVDACAGALYGYERDDQLCHLRASFAFVEREHLSSRFGLGEGIVGQVALERRPLLLSNIRRSEAEVQSGTVSEPPRCIYALPLEYKDELQGVLEIASFEQVGNVQRELLDAAGAVIAASMYTLRQGQKIQQLLEQTQATNAALKQKSDELNTANQQMLATNEELKSQAHEMQAQAAELRAQAQELERQQVQLQEADRLKSEFLSNMSHELRTPLNSVLALSQLMIARGVGKSPEQEQDFLRVIERNGRQLLALINDILDLSKIERGRMDVIAEDFDGCNVAQQVVETVEPLAHAKSLTLTVQAPTPARLRSDESKVRQILLNLVSNAVKFTDRGGVSVAVREEAGMVRFCVRDTGMGISEHDLRYVFDEFRQVDGSTTRRHEGTGLGLAICKRLAALLGGSIEAESTPGMGSVFTLSIPRGTSAATEASTPHPSSPAPGKTPAPAGPREALSTERPLVLVIDDAQDARRALRQHLECAGYRVMTARDGAEGLELARRFRPAAITLDLAMPAMDGWEVITRLKSLPDTRGIPVLIASVSEDAATGAALGASAHLVKPVDPSMLVSEIDRLGGNRHISRVLLVDNDRVAREHVARVLGERGYHVDVACGGTDGLALARQAHPEVVVRDLAMPASDGFAVLAAGCEDCLAKPIDPTALASASRRWGGEP